MQSGNPLKLAAVELYRAATRPWRRHLDRRQAAEGKARVMAFFYHRVAAEADSPISMSFETFQAQVDFLQAHFKMISLEQSVERIRVGNYAPTAHITFDDGYADNCEAALPYLIAKRVPTTYFVASWHVKTGTPFQHDEKNGKTFAVNTPQQIRAMADAGIEIGSHTRHHADLGEVHDEATLRDEIVESKKELEDMIGRPVRYFAFPFGMPKQITPAAVAMLKEAGYEAICSAFGAYNFPGADPFHVQRIHGDNEMPRFKNWATLDPRKLKIYLPLPQASQIEQQTVTAR
jgi:peptidoglycan/xylan/chitin deacetylase (PgdA/CDA1 family)